MKLAIIGAGCVGKAVAQATEKRYCTVSVFDKNPQLTRNMGTFAEAEICFVCVPTPSSPHCDVSNVVESAQMLDKMKFKGVVVVKSTVIPGTMARLAKQYPKLRFVHNPEFLTEKNALADFVCQKAVLLSGKPADTVEVDKFYANVMSVKDSYISTEFEVTEWAKYLHNCALAVKISFLNEVHEAVGDQSIFDRAVQFAMPFGNLGPNSKVPGPDGKLGFAGACFIKDTLALRMLMKNGSTLQGAINTNNRIRPTAYDGTERTGLENETHLEERSRRHNYLS